MLMNPDGFIETQAERANDRPAHAKTMQGAKEAH